MSTTKSHEMAISSLAVVNGSQRETNRSTLQPILFDLIALGRIVKQLHWNVVGPHFRPLHLHLDEIHEVVEDAIDTVAERLTATGHTADGRLRATAENTELDDVPEGFLVDDEVLRLASFNLRRAVELIRSRTEEIEDVDTATADLLHQIELDLEKHHWMLEAQRVAK
jgi:starvation-inducible DNA-binding protein